MFSEREEVVIKVLGRKKLTIAKITFEVFKHCNFVLDPEIAVNNSITRIIKKCKHHKLNWTLVKKRVDGKLLISKEKVC